MDTTKFINSKNSIIGIKIIPRDPEEDIKLNKSVEEYEKELLNKGAQNDEGLRGSSGEERKRRKSKDKLDPKGWKRYFGICMGITSSIIFSLGVLIVKYFKEYQPSSVAIWRFQGILIPSFFLIIHGLVGEKKDKEKKKMFAPLVPLCQPDKLKISFFLLMRAVTGASAVILQYYSLRYMSMADSTVIVFSAPVFVTFLARIFLGEKFGAINILCALLTLLGVTIIARPPFLTGAETMDIELLTGVGLALAAMTVGCWVFLTLRMLKGINHSVVGFFFGLYGTIESGILAAIIGTFELPGNSFNWFLAVFVAGITFFGQLCMTLALKNEEASVIALCRCMDVVFSFIYQLIFFGVVPDYFSILGSSAVMLGVILVFFRKHLSMLPENHPRRQRFCLILK